MLIAFSVALEECSDTKKTARGANSERDAVLPKDMCSRNLPTHPLTERSAFLFKSHHFKIPQDLTGLNEILDLDVPAAFSCFFLTMHGKVAPIKFIIKKSFHI